jgi:hypothetical protein
MEKFDVTECAAYVIQTINMRYYRKLLAAIECEAVRCGYGFEESVGETNTAPSTLPPELRDALAGALLRAKVQILAPGVPDTDVEGEVERRVRDDEGRPWLDEILFALHLRGVRLVRQAGNSVIASKTLADHEA